MATLILPLPFLVTIFRPPNKEPLTLPVEESVKTLAHYGDINFFGGGFGNIITRSGVRGNGDLTILGGGNVVTWSTTGELKAKLGGVVDYICRTNAS
jgi:hypothetical protein